MLHLADPASIDPGVLSWLFLAGVLLLLPVAVVVQERQLRIADAVAQPVTRRDIYVGALLTHAVLLTAALLASREAGADVFRVPALAARDIVVGATALGIGMLTLVERFTPPAGRARTDLIAPRTPREHALFGAVAVSAGVAEEVAYRGVLFVLLAHFLGGWWVPAVIAGAAFGVVHLFQGWRAAFLAAGGGMVAQIVVGLTGTLVVAIVVHVLHDLIAGAVIGRRARSRATGGEPVAV